MTVAITGATGFLGLHLAAELAKTEERLIVLARRTQEQAAEEFDRFSPGLSERITVIRSDVAQPLLGLEEADFRRLADEIDELWHSAGDTSLATDAPKVRRVNVRGTRHVLDLLTAGERRPALRHISTVAVAGRRAHGCVGDGDLDDSHGFNNTYERAKYDAELLVHEWAAEHGREATILRPSGLATDRPGYPGRPRHIVESVADALAFVLANHPGLREGLPFPASPQAITNIIPVEHAAALTVAYVRRLGSAGVHSCNIAAASPTPFGDFVAVLGEHLGIPVWVGEARTPEQEAAHADFPGIFGHGRFTRTYSLASLASVGLSVPDEPRADVDYMRATLAIGTAVR